MVTPAMSDADRQRAIEEFMAAGKGTRLEYQGKPLEYVEWEKKEAARRSANGGGLGGKTPAKGKGSKSPFFRRGAGVI